MSPAASAVVLDNEVLGDDLAYSISTGSEVFEGISIDIEPKSQRNYFTISAIGANTSLTVNGSTQLSSLTTGPDNQDGTYSLFAEDGASIHLNGDVYISARHTVNSKYGANAVYAEGRGATINIGSEDGKSSTFISSIAPKPDAISVKQGAAVNIRSTQTQIIGSVDMAYSRLLKTAKSSIRAVFSIYSF